MFMLDLLSFYGFLGGGLMIEFDELGCVDLISVLPGVIAFGVSLPFDQIL
jgi:hypothetical protein